MKCAWFLIVLVVSLLVISVFAADLCTDTDGGGGKSDDDASLTKKGSVKYGITPAEDVCLTAEEKGLSTNSSDWLKEYYCDKSDHRKLEIYNCKKLGYAKCENGACVGVKSKTSSSSDSSSYTVGSCGNKIVDKSKGEECDPPGSICFGKTTVQYGSCQADCKCKIAAAALENIPKKCGDGIKHSDEACEEDADCASVEVCSSCSCVKKLTKEEIEALKKKQTTSKDSDDKKSIEEQIHEKYKTPELPEVDVNEKNFSEEPGIRATSGIANFFKRLFSWLAGLFT